MGENKKELVSCEGWKGVSMCVREGERERKEMCAEPAGLRLLNMEVREQLESQWKEFS